MPIEKERNAQSDRKITHFMRQIPQKDCYAFQCDIENYFISINKHIVFKLLFKHIRNARIESKR